MEQTVDRSARVLCQSVQVDMGVAYTAQLHQLRSFKVVKEPKHRLHQQKVLAQLISGYSQCTAAGRHRG